MKLIFSRKGFDSGSGGVPSPIFPDGRFFSLPIPDRNSDISYNELKDPYGNPLSELVGDLTKNKVKPYYKAHLDPDLNYHALNRAEGWRPIFGQEAAALGHLRNNNVSVGDLFIFWGLYRDIELIGDQYVFVPKASRKHVIFGWFQIGEIYDVNSCPESIRKWASYHPHFAEGRGINNAIFIASDKLSLPDLTQTDIAGAGLFSKYKAKRQLTDESAASPCDWELPECFWPEGKNSILTYHRDLSRWSRKNGKVHLNTVARGQEFILDCDDYPEAIEWAFELITN